MDLQLVLTLFRTPPLSVGHAPRSLPAALHELAHSVMHDADAKELPNRSMREVQAESVAYAVSAALGLDTSGYSFGYVASWAVFG